MNEKIETVIFDVGGVLIDFCWERYCMELGFSEDVIRTFHDQMICSEIWDFLDEGTIRTENAIQEFEQRMPQYAKEVRRFWQHPEFFVEEYGYAGDLIRSVKEKGYAVYLLSNYPYDMYKMHWPKFSFYSMVDGYVVSAEEKLRKPDPAIYHLILERYHLVPDTCLFIDDRKNNTDAAIRVGMNAVQFTDAESVRKLLAL